jgi:hypothetical protein
MSKYLNFTSLDPVPLTLLFSVWQVEVLPVQAVGWYYTECHTIEWRFLHFVHCEYDLSLIDRIRYERGNYMDKGEGDDSLKLPLSVITTPIVLTQLRDFFNRRCHVNPQCSNIHPANLFRPAYSRYIHVRANILALWIFISWIGKADRKRNWSCPIGQDSCAPKAKTKADWLHKSQNLISTKRQLLFAELSENVTEKVREGKPN